MRIVLQRVRQASVSVDGEVTGAISAGLLILLGVAKPDTQADVDFLAEKVVNLRIFADEQGKTNRSVKEVEGGILVVSQFTLYGDCRKGRRPSFDDAAPPEHANNLYRSFVERLRSENLKVETGVFQAHMQVSLVNDGPVTFVLESKLLH